MSDSFTFFERFEDIENLPNDGILSRTVLNEPSLRLVLFHFAEGQELTDHTSATPAVIQIISGEATLRLGEETREAHPGTLVYMPAKLNHAVFAKTNTTMLLHMLKSAKPAQSAE